MQQTYHNISNKKLRFFPNPQTQGKSEEKKTENVQQQRLQFIFASFLLYLVCFQFCFYTSFFIKTFFFGECKREVKQKKQQFVVAPFLFSVFVECVRVREKKKQILMWYLAPIHSFVQHLLLITSRILYKKYQRI